jgi:hypothetical protein
MRYGEMGTWDTKLVPALAVLSAATMAQRREVNGLIVGAVERRGGKIGEEKDVIGVGQELYRRAME